MKVSRKIELERARLESLRSYDIMDTSSDSLLDNMTALAAYVCDTPISLISLLDDKRQWFKSNVGLKVTETPIELAFCNYAIDHKELFEVEDAQKDKRFCDNPLVTGDPNIRFYAGFPLINQAGFALGTLCVIDRKPRKLNGHQKNAIEVLSQLVITSIETNLHEKLMKEAMNSRRELINEVNFEMRTPLNAIMGVSMLLLEKNKDDNLKEDLELLNSSADSLLELVDNLTKSNETITEPFTQHVTFDLHAILQQVIDEVKDVSTLQINFIYDYSIPKLLVGDLERLSQILRHLIASRQIGRSKTKLLLEIQLVAKNNNIFEISFDFIDESTSVLSQDIRSHFEQNMKRNLAMEMIDHLKGAYYNKPNQMSFTLPFKTPELKQVPENNPFDISSVKLLLVEDLQTNQRIAAQFLNKWKVEFDIVENGKQALDAVRANAYDVILMDMRMPVMDGYEATLEIKSMNNGKYKDLPIIALTASVSGLKEEKYKKLDLAGFVSKPFNPEVLRSTIARSLQSRKVKK